MEKELIENFSVAVEAENLEKKLDFERLFGRSGPVEIEIGSGKGVFLLSEAPKKINVNFLGIEYARPYYLHAVKRLSRWGVTNVRMIRTEASRFLQERIRPDSVEGFHIYFPDPWPKRKHHKRRFLQRKNMDILLRVLKRGGFIRIVTDYKSYFEKIEKLLCQYKSTLQRVDFTPAVGAEDGEYVGTNFERKYLRQGRAVYTVEVRKTNDA